VFPCIDTSRVGVPMRRGRHRQAHFDAITDLPQSEGGQIVRHRFPSNRLHHRRVLRGGAHLALVALCALAARSRSTLLPRRNAPAHHRTSAPRLASAIRSRNRHGVEGRVMAWRDKYKVHPLADLLPMMPDDELAKLGEDIKANGLKEQIP